MHLDLGNYFRPLGPDSREVNALMLESLSALPIRVLNLAPEDLFYWAELAGAELPSTQVISTNLVPIRRGLKTPARYAVIEIPAAEAGLKRDLRIGFLGLSDPARVKPNSGFEALDPLEAVEQVKGELRDRADFLVVLADLPRSLGARLALQHPEVYAVLLTEKAFRLWEPEMVNNAVILSSVERGRYLGRLTLQVDGTGRIAAIRPDAIELDAKVPEEPAFLERQSEVAARISR